MEIKTVTKRDGRIVPFDEEKIATAIYKAAQSVGGNDFNEAKRIASKVVRFIDNENPNIEQIQDVVEKVLIEEGHAKVAKAYILYRADRTRSRDMNTKLMKIYEDLTFKNASDCDIKRENANIDGDTAMGTMLKYGSEGAKEFNLLYVLPKNQAKAHSEGDIHIHDFDFMTLTETCCQIDLTKLFEGGFSTGHGVLREPSTILSYASLACIAIQSNQNDMHGGQAVPNFDRDMAPGVAKSFIKNIIKTIDVCIDDVTEETLKEIKNKLEEFRRENKSVMSENSIIKIKNILHQCFIVPDAVIDKVIRKAKKYTVKDTYQAMEALIHNLNTMNSRAGAQVPFSSVNFGTDTSAEGRIVIEQFLLATEAGLGNGETPIFPISIFKVKDGINYNEGEPNYDLFKLACRVSAKRLFPNFSFIDAPFNLQYYDPNNYHTEIAYMGCRTRVIGNTYDPSREIVTGRGNLSFTSVNLPRLAIEANGSIPVFFEKLEDTMNLVIEQLMFRFKIQCQKKVKNYPFLMGQGVWIDSDKLSKDDSIAEVLKHGTLSMGFIGLAETLIALTGKHHGESKESQELGLRIVGRMRERMDEESKKTGLNFSLLATPAEGLSGRFVRMDAKRYGIIKGVTDKDYYTNSFHVPVYYEISAFDKIKIEAPYHALTNAGHISYIELDGDPSKNLEAFETVVRCMKESGIGYGAINHPVDRDPVCGYNGVIDDVCPKCGRHENENGGRFDRIRRITGYLVGTLDRFNNAKKAEESQRVKHGVNSSEN